MTNIIYKMGNIVDCDELYIAHGCNSQGVFNAGVAKSIRNKYPSVYVDYINSNMSLGEHNPSYDHMTGKTIFNCITQKYYGNDKSRRYVDYNALTECLLKINYHVSKKMSNIITNGDNHKHDWVAMPKIGCGLGGGDWYIVSKIIEENSPFFQPVVYEL